MQVLYSARALVSLVSRNEIHKFVYEGRLEQKLAGVRLFSGNLLYSTEFIDTVHFLEARNGQGLLNYVWRKLATRRKPKFFDGYSIICRGVLPRKDR